MEPYNKTSELSIGEQEDAPYYCSPAFGPEDVIWPGSDAEETAEETEQKRLRYEDHAKRYMRGHLPVLQSATLRGPLSGWVNPWRWVPKQDEWWQPGSEDMLFTREKVMKRAADHGLGYLGPTEALAWCKASAQAEAQRINRDGSMEQDTPPEIRSTFVELDLEESQDHLTKAEFLEHNSRPTNPYEDQSMINHHSETPYTSERVGMKTKGTKRPVDAHWLKGSYVSKRARWDGPEIPTPTPHHEVADKYRRQHHSFPERSESNNETTCTTSRFSVSFADIASAQGQIDVTMDTATPDFASHDRGQASITSASALNSAHKRSSIEQDASNSQLHKDENDELQEISQEAFFSSSLRSKSSRKPRRRSHRSTEVSSVIVEGVECDAIIPRKPSPNSILPSHDSARDVTLSPISNELPKFRRQSLGLQSDRHLREFEEEDEYSFVTEVAPSSRDLEMFQYKKKRKRMDGEWLKPKQNERSSKAHLQTTPSGTPLPSRQGAQEENVSDDGDSIKAKIYDQKLISPLVDEALVAGNEMQEKSNQSDKSWDFMDDAMEQTSALSMGCVSPRATTSSKRPSRIDRKSPIQISQTLKPVSMSSSQRSKISRGSTGNSQSLPGPRKSPSKSSATKLRAIFHDLNDGSTQSYNTSPPRPTPNIPFEPLPLETQDVISAIQRSASQHGPPSSSPAHSRSNNSRAHETGDLNMMEVGFVQDPPLDQRHAPRSSGVNASFHSLLEGNIRTTEGGVDELAEIADFGDTPQLRGSSQQRDFGTETSEKGAEPETDPSPAVSTPRTQHISPKDTNEPQLQQTDEGEVLGALTSDKIPTPVNLEEFRPPLNAHPKASSIDPDTSWEGCGPQSPWAAENLELLPVNPHGQVNRSTPATSGGAVAGSLGQRLSSPDSDDRSEGLDWQAGERPQTPAVLITPFKDLMSPSPEPESRNHHLESNGLPNTQSLVDAAINNPWTSNLKNPSSKKSNKRVSFGVLESEEKENSQPDLYGEIHRLRRSPGSPPPPRHDSDEDIYDDGTATLPKFIGHFVAARQFKHTLPQNTSSPVNSSPHLSAQAEAFIAADRRASVDGQLSRFSPRLPLHKSRADMGRIEENSWTRNKSPSSVQMSPKSPEKRMGNIMASFDMDDAIGDMSDFLGDDWSIEAELKKAKGSKALKSSGRRESNGHKRRRLFGLV